MNAPCMCFLKFNSFFCCFSNLDLSVSVGIRKLTTGCYFVSCRTQHSNFTFCDAFIETGTILYTPIASDFLAAWRQNGMTIQWVTLRWSRICYVYCKFMRNHMRWEKQKKKNLDFNNKWRLDVCQNTDLLDRESDAHIQAALTRAP